MLHFNDPDNGKSTTGYIIRLGENPIIFKSNTQKGIPARSSAEAEYRAAARYATDLIWFQRLASVSQIPGWNEFTITYEDNQSCIKTAKNPFVQGRSRSYHLMYHAVRASVDEKVLHFKYVQTDKQLADIMTKPLPKTSFLNHRSKLLFLLKNQSTPKVCLRPFK